MPIDLENALFELFGVPRGGAAPTLEQTPETGYGIAPNAPVAPRPKRLLQPNPDAVINPDAPKFTDDIDQSSTGGVGFHQRPAPTIRQAEQAHATGENPQPLGNFASQFAFGGQGPRSYTHSLRPERGKVVR